MADLQTLVDHIHYENRRDYTYIKGDVAYLDGSPLSRPFSMPSAQRVIMVVIIIVAVILGGIFVNNTVIASLQETLQSEQMVNKNLQREASIETIPWMPQVVNMSNDEIVSMFEDAGYNIYLTSDADDEASLSLYKLPSDVSTEEAIALYAKGISKISAVQASKLLNGSWYFSADRDGGTTMVVRYADFSTGDPQRAMRNAMSKEGITDDLVTESGVDDSGNTYSMGGIDAAGVPCVWKVSALPLSDMYSITGLPEDACYVGVRITVQNNT